MHLSFEIGCVNLVTILDIIGYTLWDENTTLTKNFIFSDFESFGLQNPLYFNVVRDPFQRFRSRFHWTRADFQAPFWYAYLHYLEPDASPAGRTPFE